MMRGRPGESYIVTDRVAVPEFSLTTHNIIAL